ncbi:hypothetical protein Cni_G20808 [Canna indica]|uniref:Uncharacterized protein n=1 Tax=Canna indica TaxID=4628 RepID=A0AAQ3QI34_9LILI|nr:hypothetical protein Cni_G20808 [Canna indica]
MQERTDVSCSLCIHYKSGSVFGPTDHVQILHGRNRLPLDHSNNANFRTSLLHIFGCPSTTMGWHEFLRKVEKQQFPVLPGMENEEEAWSIERASLSLLWCWSLWNYSIFNEISADWTAADWTATVPLGFSFWLHLNTS